jgi:hypothetical protein
MHLSVVEKTGHVGLVLEVTGVLCSCPAARDTIPVSAASGWTVVMLGGGDPYFLRTLIMGRFFQHVRIYEMTGCTLEEVDRKSCLVFRC